MTAKPDAEVLPTLDVANPEHVRIARETVEAADALITPDPIPVFDSVPEADAPRFVIVDNCLVATEFGVRIPLFFQTKKLREMPDNFDLLEQIYFLNGEESELAKQLDELDITDSREIARMLFQAYQEKQQARLGK